MVERSDTHQSEDDRKTMLSARQPMLRFALNENLKMKRITTISLLLISCSLFLPLTFAAESSSQRSEWERTIEAAKKDGQLTIYHWGTPLMLDAGVFQKAYPEIKVTTVSAMGTDLMQRILAERRGEKFIPDVYIAGIASMVVLHKTKPFDPIKNSLILPEVSDESKWWRGKHTYGDAERGHIFTFTKSPDYGSIAINTKLVDPSEFRSYWDFLQPKWRSKIVVQDLRGGGPGSTPLRFMYYNPDLGAKFLRQLYSGMDVMLYRDNRLALDWLGSGKYAIAFFVQKVEEAETRGLPVLQFKQTMKEGVGLSSRVGHMALLNRAPHPNAAKVFINWFLSREGQDLLQRVHIAAHDPADSLRIDIAKNQIPSADRRQEGVKYIDLDEHKVFDPTPAIQLIKDTLGEIGK
jgi:iron(III) transport system substrate-binding protein